MGLEPINTKKLLDEKIRESVLHSQNFRNNLNHVGFGLFENSMNNILVCRLNNGLKFIN